MPPIIYLIDGHALAYRMYFALTQGDSSRWVTSKGEPTAGVYGFASVLMKIYEQENPDYLAVAFDTGKTFRDEMFPEYKATREKMPDDLRSQIERMRELVDAFNIPRLEMEGYEADDILGSVANRAVEKGLGVKIFTGDRDLLQLVDERIIVNLPGRSLSDAKDYLEQDVFDYFGVSPNQVIDYKALVGDSSDNIPGVRGVGKKTAVALLSKYETLDGVYAHLDELKPGVRKKLEENRDNAYLSQKLATIIIDLDIEINLENARPDHFDPKRVRSLFRELEFRSHQNRLIALEKMYGIHQEQRNGQQLSMFGQPTSPIIDSTSAHGKDERLEVTIVNSEETLRQLVDVLNSSLMISFDTETTSTDQMQAELVGISLAVSTEQGYYIPVGHQTTDGTQLPLEVVVNALHSPLTNPDIKKAGHNVKYDYIVLSRHGLKVTPLSVDTMLAEWLINPDSRNLGLKNLAWVRLDHQMTSIDELIGKGKKQISMALVDINKAARYAIDDAATVLALWEQLRQDLEEKSAIDIFNEIEMPLVPVLAEMEIAGIALDRSFLAGMSEEISSRLLTIEDEIYRAVGMPFNINSPQQLSKALFETLGLDPPDRTRKTASGFYSTAAGVLENLRERHPVVNKVLTYRELSKLRNTYVDALPTQVNRLTRRVHTSYNQAGSVTGRLASSNPNLQNIPIRTEQGRKVRKAFIAEPGNQLLAIDYSQVELRIAAHMAQDQAMIQAFREDRDIHTTTASVVFNVDNEQVSSEQRRHAKAINFGLIYGMSAFGLTRSTELTLAEAEDFVDAYFNQFPGVKRYLDGIRLLAAEQGYVETLLGRRRYFPGLINPSNQNVKKREEREAINAPIQGTAADIMKLAMLEVGDALKENNLSGRMLLQVHDELVLEVPFDELLETARIVQGIMENAFKLDVPLKTDAHSGKNWGELAPLVI